MYRLLLICLVVMTLPLLAKSDEITEAQYLLSSEYGEIIKLADDDKTELIVEGVITDIKPVVNSDLYYQKGTNKRRYILVYQDIKFKIKDIYKGKYSKEEITVFINGGTYEFEGRTYQRTVSNQAHPFLDKGDQILMGLKKDLRMGGYKHSFGKRLQFPATDDLIDNIEQQRVDIEKKEKAKKEKKDFLSEDENLLLDEKGKQKAKVKKQKMKWLKKMLKERFSKRGK